MQLHIISALPFFLSELDTQSHLPCINIILLTRPENKLKAFKAITSTVMTYIQNLGNRVS